jgi:hypothetical protein
MENFLSVKGTFVYIGVFWSFNIVAIYSRQRNKYKGTFYWKNWHHARNNVLIHTDTSSVKAFKASSFSLEIKDRMGFLKFSGNFDYTCATKCCLFVQIPRTNLHTLNPVPLRMSTWGYIWGY